MRAFVAAFVLQVRTMRRMPSVYMSLLSTPLQAIIFLSVIQATDRPDLVTHALVAPTLINMWSMCIWTGGAVIRDDRWQQTLELVVASPAPFFVNVLGRIAAVASLTLLSIPVVLVTAWVTYRVEVTIRHPGELAATLLVMVAAMACTAVILASLTVLSRAAITFQNSASYPFLLLGGVFVPLALLPGWVQPVGKFVFLSWASDLVRDSISADSVTSLGYRLSAIAALGLGGLLVGRWLLAKILDRIRHTGRISHA